ncbi:hypothetical protein EDD22DRAFT_849259 [Suillus occidentalis]|nr:hypothetical protein EDD22DRAFT_849259 [Suillus occidentalis]
MVDTFGNNTITVPDKVSTSGPQTSEFQDKGKGKAVAIDLAPEVEGSRKRKSPMISGHSSQPPKSAMKSRKCAKSTQPVKSAPDVKSEDEEDTILQPISCGVPEVVLPQLSTIVVRTPQVPRSPGSPKKQNFGPASKTAGSRLEVSKSPISRPQAMQTSSSRPEVVEPTDDTAGASDGEPPAIPPFDITVPGPITKLNVPAAKADGSSSGQYGRTVLCNRSVNDIMGNSGGGINGSAVVPMGLSASTTCMI